MQGHSIINVHTSEHRSPSKHLIKSNDEYWMGQTCGHRNYSSEEWVDLSQQNRLPTESWKSIFLSNAHSERAMLRRIYIYPSCVYYMSWFVASDQFIQLPSLRRRHKVKNKCTCTGSISSNPLTFHIACSPPCVLTRVFRYIPGGKCSSMCDLIGTF